MSDFLYVWELAIRKLCCAKFLSFSNSKKRWFSSFRRSYLGIFHENYVIAISTASQSNFCAGARQSLNNRVRAECLRFMCARAIIFVCICYVCWMVEKIETLFLVSFSKCKYCILR